ncbi:hypothetical protein GQ53DRAFT_233088 [Thozetella sp. PMI_491]|nr:hypothetical protein GQ53DRAFT_233088 [Thozetella sp. PMI_491]
MECLHMSFFQNCWPLHERVTSPHEEQARNRENTEHQASPSQTTAIFDAATVTGGSALVGPACGKRKLSLAQHRGFPHTMSSAKNICFLECHSNHMGSAVVVGSFKVGHRKELLLLLEILDHSGASASILDHLLLGGENTQEHQLEPALASTPRQLEEKGASSSLYPTKDLFVGSLRLLFLPKNPFVSFLSSTDNPLPYKTF